MTTLELFLIFALLAAVVSLISVFRMWRLVSAELDGAYALLDSTTESKRVLQEHLRAASKMIRDDQRARLLGLIEQERGTS